MPSAIVDRFQQALDARQLKQAHLAKALGIREAAFSRFRKSGKGLDTHWHAIADYLDVSLDWLVLGRGSPREHLSMPQSTPAPPCLRIVGEVSAGPGLLWDADDVAESLTIPPELLAVRVTGTSAEPIILDGQFALLAGPDRRPQPGDLVCIQTTTGSSHVKRYRRDAYGQQNVFLSLNPDDDPLVVPDDNIHLCRVVIGAVYEAPARSTQRMPVMRQTQVPVPSLLADPDQIHALVAAVRKLWQSGDKDLSIFGDLLPADASTEDLDQLCTLLDLGPDERQRAVHIAKSRDKTKRK